MKNDFITHITIGHPNRNGGEIWNGGQHVYSAGNHVQDSTQPALCESDRLLLNTTHQFCINTARGIAAEQDGRFAGMGSLARRNSA